MKEKIYLLQLKAHKSSDAFAKIYDLYVDKIYRFIYFKVNNETEAQDLTSEVFLKAWQYIVQDERKDVKYLSAFLYTLARNTVADFYRSKRQLEVSIDESADLVDDTAVSVESKLDVAADMTVVNSALGQLKDEYREVIVLRFMEQLSLNEISKIIDKSPGATRVLLHRAMNTLRKIITQ